MSRTARNSDVRGVSFVEISIAIVVLALGLMPILSMMCSGTRQSAFSEYHLFASIRAQRIAEELLTFSIKNFEQVEGGGQQLTALASSITGQDSAFPREYTAKLAPGGYAEEVSSEKLDDGLVMLTVQIRWAFPAEANGVERTHVFTYRRALARPDVSFTEEIPLSGAVPPVS